MGRHTRFESIVRGMREVLDCPLTVKMRTGIYKKNWNAHKLIPKLRDWGVSMVTVRTAPPAAWYYNTDPPRSMAGLDSRDTQNWQTGITSGHVSKWQIPCLYLVRPHLPVARASNHILSLPLSN